MCTRVLYTYVCVHLPIFPPFAHTSTTVVPVSYTLSSPGISNAEFHCGKAEDVLPELIKNETSTEVVGILDPPRGGIGQSFA